MYYIPAILVAIGILVFWIIKTQSYLVGLEENTSKAMSQIALQISSQWEVLNSLVIITREYSAQRFEHIDGIVAARHAITKDSLPEALMEQENLIAEVLKEIVEVAESYPAFEDEQMYIKVMEAMEQYDNMMGTSKLIYDDSAGNFNGKILKFPTVLIARALGFSKKECFDDCK